MRAVRLISLISILGGAGYAAFRWFAPFTSSIRPIPLRLRQKMMGTSWREGCPTPIEDLSLVRVRYRNYWGFSSVGSIVVASEVAHSLVNAFRDLYEMGFKIEKINPVSKYLGSDAASMAANNTSAFNCRRVEVVGSDAWSEHARGTAIDINPIQNPYVSSGGNVEPAAGARYANRTLVVKGTITPEIASIFESYGWRWGGNWSSSKDYQHFSTSGR